jgi:REP element-mobilizing transposase RayT
LLRLVLKLVLGLRLGWAHSKQPQPNPDRNSNPSPNRNPNGATRYCRWFCILRAMRGDVPLAYLITFRSYGTWLHGDERGSVDRFHNQYGTPYSPPNSARQTQAQHRLDHTPVTLNAEQRESVAQAIRETCDVHKWLLRALNVRTNHVHAVLSTNVRPELALNALKTNATRQLRQKQEWQYSRSPWSDGGSRRYVWTELGLERAIDYVINGQDGPPPELDPQNHLR